MGVKRSKFVMAKVEDVQHTYTRGVTRRLLSTATSTPSTLQFEVLGRRFHFRHAGLVEGMISGLSHRGIMIRNFPSCEDK